MTISVMQHLHGARACPSPQGSPIPEFEATIPWVAACLGYVGFMRVWEFTLSNPHDPTTILASDVAVDSHTTPFILWIPLHQAKTDPFRKGVVIRTGRTNFLMCTLTVLLCYLTAYPVGEGPLSSGTTYPSKGTGLSRRSGPP